jgi:hypothetical protein
MSIARNILDAKELPHDPDLVETVADRLQSYLRDRVKRGDVVNGQAMTPGGTPYGASPSYDEISIKLPSGSRQ